MKPRRHPLLVLREIVESIRSARINEVLSSSSFMQKLPTLLNNELGYNQFIFQNICRWLLISFFFPAQPEMTQANKICNGFHNGIFSQTGTVKQGKCVHCQNAGNYQNQQVALLGFLGLFLHFTQCLIDSENFYEKTQAQNQVILTPMKT